MSTSKTSQPARHSCLCTHAQAIRTLEAMAKTGPLTYLDVDWEMLSLIGTQLSDALIITNNGSALISERGGYAAYQPSSMPHRVSRRRVNMRVHPTTQMNAARSDGPDGRLILVVADETGHISHRIETDGGYDNLVLGALDTGPFKPYAAPNEANAAETVISLNAVRCARFCWDDWDTGYHLNDLLCDGGRIRRTTLPYVGKHRAWPILKTVLSSFVGYLQNNAIGHVQSIPGSGFIQSSLAKTGTVELLDQILITQEGNRTFAIDLSHIDSVWATRIGPVSQLEIYDHTGKAIAVLAADPNADYGHWNALLESLPPAAYSIAK